MKNKNILYIVLVTAALLLIPLIVERFNTEVNWTPLDFVFAGILIFGTGFAYELLSRRSGMIAYRAAVALALVGVFLLIWINGAVGIIGNENNPANLLYGVVILVLLFGSIIAQLQSHKMTYVLFVTAVIQGMVPVVAFIAWRPDFSPGVNGVFILNAFFVLLFAISGSLFQRAARETIRS